LLSGGREVTDDGGLEYGKKINLNKVGETGTRKKKKKSKRDNNLTNR